LKNWVHEIEADRRHKREDYDCKRPHDNPDYSVSASHSVLLHGHILSYLALDS